MVQLFSAVVDKFFRSDLRDGLQGMEFLHSCSVFLENNLK